MGSPRTPGPSNSLFTPALILWTTAFVSGSITADTSMSSSRVRPARDFAMLESVSKDSSEEAPTSRSLRIFLGLSGWLFLSQMVNRWLTAFPLHHENHSG